MTKADSFQQPDERRTAWTMLAFNTLAFTICFAAWMMNGVLVTYFVEKGLFDLDVKKMSVLIGIPVLTGAIFRLPLGMLTDRYGGRIVYGLLLIFSAIPMFLMSYCQTYTHFIFASLGFGFTGTSFAVGIAYTSVWFPKRLQGTALGIFGAGNAGAALTALGAPQLLKVLTDNGENIDGWRQLPIYYATALLVMGVLFLIFTKYRIPLGGATKTMRERLAPLKDGRVWRFGFYYFFVFGGFVALAQWLIPYYVNVYSVSIGMAGFLTAFNSFPSGVIRAFGGYLSDKKGARVVMYWVFSICLICCALLVVPQMDIHSPGSGVQAMVSGTVVSVTDEEIVVRSKAGVDKAYAMVKKEGELATEEDRRSGMLIWPTSQWWQEAAVEAGDKVKRKELLARGMTHIFFQANIWVFTFLSFLLGATMGVGKAAVYKFIPDYYRHDVGAVGGIVGVLGGLGGFVCPVVFGYLLKATGLWTTCWMFFFVITAICLIWMHVMVLRSVKGTSGSVASIQNGGD